MTYPSHHKANGVRKRDTSRLQGTVFPSRKNNQSQSFKDSSNLVLPPAPESHSLTRQQQQRALQYRFSSDRENEQPMLHISTQFVDRKNWTLRTLKTSGSFYFRRQKDKIKSTFKDLLTDHKLVISSHYRNFMARKFKGWRKLFNIIDYTSLAVSQEVQNRNPFMPQNTQLLGAK